MCAQPHAEAGGGDVLHESHGLLVLRRPNGACVVELDWTADPAKDEAWAEGVQAFIPHWAWLQEYERDWDAQAGAAVFDMWDDTIHVVHIPRQPPRGVTCFRAIDSGYNSPAACLWIYLDGDGNRYVYRELYQSGLNAVEFAKTIIKMSHGERYHGTWADPACWEERQASPVSVAQQMARQGLRMTKALGRNDEDGIQAIAFGLTNAIIKARGGKPLGYATYISSLCPNAIREHKAAVFKKSHPEKNVSEKIKDKNNHTIDCHKYFELSNPQRVDREESQKTIQKFLSIGQMYQ
jgi:hypothetical protein